LNGLINENNQLNYKDMIIAVDFDGTIVEHIFPEIGESLYNSVATLKRLIANGHDIILFTCRTDLPERKYLTEAIEWCRLNGIELAAVNSNVDKTLTFADKKPLADIYIDDRAIFSIINWERFEQYFESQGFFDNESD